VPLRASRTPSLGAPQGPPQTPLGAPQRPPNTARRQTPRASCARQPLGAPPLGHRQPPEQSCTRTLEVSRRRSLLRATTSKDRRPLPRAPTSKG
jgi:hypothetical protein